MTRSRRARSPDSDVLIVGAGIAGLTAAAKLAELGIGVELVERRPGPPAAGAGIMLHPNALAHLAHLQPSLPESGSWVERQLILDAAGGLTGVDWREVWEQGLPLAIHRLRLAELMVRRLPPVLVRWETAPASLQQDADFVHIGLSSGESRSYRMVVGADGIHSWVRRATGIAASPRYLGQLYWRTTTRAAAPLTFPEWRVWRAGGHSFGAMPIGRGRMHVFLQAEIPEIARVESSRSSEQFRRIVSMMGTAVTDLVAALKLEEDWEVRPALGLSASRWACGRVAIIGDAAHAVSPASTQGGGLATEDAAVLADEVRRHGPGPAALAAYEARRRPRIAAFTRMVDLHRTFMALTPPPGAEVRRVSGGDAVRWMRRLYQPLLEPP